MSYPFCPACGMNYGECNCTKIEQLISLVNTVILNSEIIFDPRYDGMTDCYAVSLEDMDKLKEFMERKAK